MNEPRDRKKYERDYYARANVIRRLRSRAHMTLEDLEKSSGVNYTTINRIERGHNKSPQWKTLIPLAKALGVAVDDIVVYTDELSGEPRYPGGAKNEQDFEEGLDAEARLRERREANGGNNGDSSGGRRT